MMYVALMPSNQRATCPEAAYIKEGCWLAIGVIQIPSSSRVVVTQVVADLQIESLTCRHTTDGQHAYCGWTSGILPSFSVEPNVDCTNSISNRPK